MKKIFLLLACLTAPGFATAAADWGTKCSTIKTLRAWQGGSDTYGLRIEFKEPYEGCGDGFYVPHAATNKQYVYSTALAAFTADLKACVQIELVSNSIGNMCKLNQIYLTK